MVSRFYAPKYPKEFRLLSKTLVWLRNQPNADEALGQLVANAKALKKNSPLAVKHGESAADEELEICYEQIETLKQLLKHQTQVAENYLKEIKDLHQEIQACNQEMASLQGRLLIESRQNY